VLLASPGEGEGGAERAAAALPAAGVDVVAYTGGGASEERAAIAVAALLGCAAPTAIGASDLLNAAATLAIDGRVVLVFACPDAHAAAVAVVASGKAELAPVFPVTPWAMSAIDFPGGGGSAELRAFGYDACAGWDVGEGEAWGSWWK